MNATAYITDSRVTEQLNTLIPCGFDPGNGFAKICLFGKVAKIPANFAYEEPQGQLSGKTLARTKAKAFSLIKKDQILWFGLDSLDNGTGKEIDQGKYNPDYLRDLFAASLVQWFKQHRESVTILEGHKLNIVASMPPELYQDRTRRNRAERVYREAFKHRIDWQVKNSLVDTFQLFTQFYQVVPETLTYMAVNQAKTDYTAVFDLGYGTLDIAIFKAGQQVPLLTKSLNNGLLHTFSSLDTLNVYQAELTILRSKDYNLLDGYFAEIKTIVQTITRKLPPDNTTVVGIGGGINLMSKRTRASFDRSFDNLTLKDEYVNVRANHTVAGGA